MKVVTKLHQVFDVINGREVNLQPEHKSMLLCMLHPGRTAGMQKRYGSMRINPAQPIQHSQSSTCPVYSMLQLLWQ